MEEKLISFEVAKLAKEKGFRSNNTFLYNLETGIPTNKWIPGGISAPTQGLLQKWLRETHNMFVVVTPEFYIDGINHNVQVLTYDPNKEESDCYDNNKCTGMYGDNGEFETYERALEFGLEKALMLIKD